MARERERGMTLIMTALCMLAIMAMAALALDIGLLYTAHTSAQHAADAAALAGAYTLLADPTGASASAAAVATAGQNSVLGTAVPAAAVTVTPNVAANPPQVTVTVDLTGTRALPTYFAQAMMIPSMGVTATATAQAIAQGSATRCLKPIFIPNTILSKLSPGTPTTAGTACGSAPQQVLYAPDGNGGYTFSTWAKNYPVPMAPTATPLGITPADPQTALTPSQFYEINLAQNAPGGGAQLFGCTLGSCLSECAGALTYGACGSSYPVLTGAKVGAVKQGIDTLIGNPPTDTYLSNNPLEFQTPAGVVNTSRGVVLAPVWDNCTQGISPGYNGQTVKIVGFVEMFISGQKGKAVQAYILGPVSCAAAGAAGGGGGGTPLTGPLGQPIRLIQNP